MDSFAPVSSEPRSGGRLLRTPMSRRQLPLAELPYTHPHRRQRAEEGAEEQESDHRDYDQVYRSFDPAIRTGSRQGVVADYHGEGDDHTGRRQQQRPPRAQAEPNKQRSHCDDDPGDARHEHPKHRARHHEQGSDDPSGARRWHATCPAARRSRAPSGAATPQPGSAFESPAVACRLVTSSRGRPRPSRPSTALHP